jgi:hypothetical protein
VPYLPIRQWDNPQHQQVTPSTKPHRHAAGQMIGRLWQRSSGERFPGFGLLGKGYQVIGNVTLVMS